jgi:hypothetical protein
MTERIETADLTIAYEHWGPRARRRRCWCTASLTTCTAGTGSPPCDLLALAGSLAAIRASRCGAKMAS